MSFQEEKEKVRNSYLLMLIFFFSSVLGHGCIVLSKFNLPNDNLLISLLIILCRTL